ncbi:MAG: DUF4011 domain-containing protein, partial [Thermoguttaceae bacterium]|nr:DUF4011 domain-containing protein [Thermoguttaceae bacterium]
MDTKKLDKWADLLLDTGKRNNLINFKDTKASTVEVLLPDPDALFEKIDGATAFEVFDPKIAEEDDLLDAPEETQPAPEEAPQKAESEPEAAEPAAEESASAEEPAPAESAAPEETPEVTPAEQAPPED